MREVALGIGPRLARDAGRASSTGASSIANPIESDARFEVITAKSPDAVPIYRHSTAHLTAQASAALSRRPDRDRPPIENGFYYDFTLASLRSEDLTAIEAEMRRIITEISDRADGHADRRGVAIFEKQGDALKVEIARGSPKASACRATGRASSSTSAGDRTSRRRAGSASSS